MRYQLLSTLSLVGALSFAGLARADVVTLRDGRQLKGDVSEEGDELVVSLKFGAVRVPKRDVVDWKRDSGDDELSRMQAQLGRGNAEERYRLGVFARDRGRPEDARKAFESVLSLDPEHAGARAALGFRQFEGRWVAEADYYKLKGMVKFGGRWVTLDEKARELNSQRQARERREAEKAAKESEKAQAKALQRAELARRRAEREEAARAVAASDPYLVRDRYGLLARYYGPYFPGAVSTYGVGGFQVSSGYLPGGYLPYSGTLPGSVALTPDQQFLAAARLRRGGGLPAHLLNPVVIVNSPGFPYGYSTLRRSGYSGYSGYSAYSGGLSVSGRFSHGNTRVGFRLGGYSGQSSSRGSSYGGVYGGSYSGFGASFSGSYQRGGTSIRFGFNP